MYTGTVNDPNVWNNNEAVTGQKFILSFSLLLKGIQQIAAVPVLFENVKSQKSTHPNV
jgi:hypothetical protein